MSTSNELFTLLYGILDKLERIESHLGIAKAKEVEPDGGVPFKVITNEPKKVIEFPTPE